MEKRFLTCAFAVAACLLLAGAANANVIAIGSTASPDAFVSGPSGALLATTGATPLVGSFNATYTESVYQDGGALDPTCPTCLDFVVTLTNNSGDNIHRITVSSMGTAATTTDVGYLFTSGGIVPDTVDRTGTSGGSVVGFNYLNTDPTNGLPAGKSTPELIIVTNALSFTSGNISAIDGVSANGAGYGVSSVPEPSLAGLLFLGSAGLMAFARRFKKSA
jgi:hypothetical protein